MANGNDVPQAGVPPVGGPPSRTDREMSRDARLWAMLCHLAGLAGFGVWVIGFVIGPLVVWMIKKDEYPFVDEQGKEAINFQLTVVIIGVVLVVTCVFLVLLPALLVLDLVFAVIAAVKANEGDHYHYPFRIRFIR